MQIAQTKTRGKEPAVEAKDSAARDSSAAGGDARRIPGYALGHDARPAVSLRGGSGGGLVQTKLAVGGHDDAFEHEADAVAERVAGGAENTAPASVTPVTPQALAPAGAAPAAPSAAAPGGVQTKRSPGAEAELEEEKKDEEAQPVQREALSGAEAVQLKTAEEERKHEEEAHPAAAVQTKRKPGREKDEEEEEKKKEREGKAEGALRNHSGGEPLDEEARRGAERAMGQDFSDVRVHNDAQSAEANRALRSRAFTNRNHVFLGAGESKGDKRLLAHEHTHVLQQRGVARRPPCDQEQKPAAPPSEAAGNGRAPKPEPGKPAPTPAPEAAKPTATPAATPAAAVKPPAAPSAEKTAAEKTAPGTTPSAAQTPAGAAASAPDAAKQATPGAKAGATQPGLTGTLKPEGPSGLSAPAGAEAETAGAETKPGAAEVSAAGGKAERAAGEAAPAGETAAAPEAKKKPEEAAGEKKGEGGEKKAGEVAPEAAAAAPEAAAAAKAGAGLDGPAPAEAASGGSEVAAAGGSKEAGGGGGGAAGVSAEGGAAEGGEGGEAAGAAETEARMAAAAGEKEDEGAAAGAGAGGGEAAAEGAGAAGGGAGEAVEEPAAEGTEEAAPAAESEAGAPKTEEVAAAVKPNPASSDAAAPAASEEAAEAKAAESMGMSGGDVKEADEAIKDSNAAEAAQDEAAAEPAAPAEVGGAAAAATTEIRGGGGGSAGGGAGAAEEAAPAEAPAAEAAAEGSNEGGGAPPQAGGDTGELAPAERSAAMSSLSEGGGGEGGEGGGGGGGGGAIPEKQEPEVPDVSTAEPAQAMASLGGLPAGKVLKGMTSVMAAVNHSVGRQRSELAANPPEMERPSGSPVTKQARTDIPAAPSESEGKPKQEVAPEGSAQPVPEPEPLPPPPPAPTQSVPEPRVSGNEKGELSDEDVDNMQSSIGRLPTSDPALNVDAGAPPPLQLEGDADPARAAEQRANLEQSVAETHAQGQRDAAQPMGEGEIYPTVPKETLKASVPSGGGGGGGGAAAAGGGEGGDAEAVSIIAEEKSGGEIQAAVSKAQGDMAAERAKHDEKVSEEKAKSQEEVARAESENAAQQEAERSKAQGEVQEARSSWSEEQQQVVDENREKADEEVAGGDEEVQRHREKGEQEAAGHIEKGNEEAAAAREEGERKAEQEKQKGEEGGFWGWLSSKAKAFFDGIKAGIKAAFEAARRAVKAAIEAAKKLAVAAIEAARKAIVDVIRRVGDALIALGDVLLAAFPGLREKWRNYIKEKVAAAEAAVNKLADDLKAGVQKLLDLLGAALDAALGLLEKGLLAAVDAANAVVQGAIKAAQAIAEALGAFLALIKDIAAAPGQWISNLAAAASDGVKNHLWKAFKTAVKEWFNSKVEEVLGIGGMIWGILTKGGIKFAEIGSMAWEAIKAAIPSVLIGLIIEKVVSMIIPAAGAVMAIIEGLQAAWGTVSRIIQAFGLFMAFLKKVKSGNAGPEFAKAVAAGAIVVIDFVGNWLVKRLRKPAGKVAGKVKAIAQRILQKIKKAASKVVKKIKALAKKALKKLKNLGRKLKAKFKSLGRKLRKLFGGKKKKGKKGKGKKDKDKKKKDKRKKQEERLEKAVAAIKPAVDKMLAGGTSGLLLKAKLLYYRLRYRLSALKLSGGNIEARVNPSKPVTGAKKLSKQELGHLLMPILAAAERQYETALMADPTARAQYDEAKAKFQAGQAGALDNAPRDVQQKVIRDIAPPAGPVVDGVQKPATVAVESGVKMTMHEAGHLGRYEVKLGGTPDYDKVLGSLQKKAAQFGIPESEMADILSGRADTINQKLDALLAGKKGGKALKETFKSQMVKVSFLTQTLEPARRRGMASATAVATTLAKTPLMGPLAPGQQGPLEQILSKQGTMAPMTPVGAASNDPEKRGPAERTGRERVGEIFHQLLAAAERQDIYVSPGGYRLNDLAAAVQLWTEQRLLRPPNRAALRSSVAMLKAELAALLKSYHGR